MAQATNDTPYIGTELVINVNIEPINNIHMSNYDFTIKAFCNEKKVVTFNKGDWNCQKVDDDNYVILLDTNDVGAGKLKLIVTAYIPDDRFLSEENDGKRTEIIPINTGIPIKDKF